MSAAKHTRGIWAESGYENGYLVSRLNRAMDLPVLLSGYKHVEQFSEHDSELEEEDVSI